MFHPQVDLAAYDPHDWSKFPEILTPLAPLTDEHKKDFPWNFTRERWMKFIFDPFHPSDVYTQLQKNKANT
jgi:hypothetical protein